MAVEQRIEAFFDLAPSFLEDRTWAVSAESRHGTLSHRDGLVRFDFRRLNTAWSSPEDFVVRPEVRGLAEDQHSELTRVEWQELLAPGDAVVKQANSMCAKGFKATKRPAAQGFSR